MTTKPSPTLYQATADRTGERLDKALCAAVPNLSRTRIQQLIEQGCVMAVDARRPVTDASAKVKAGERFEITVPPAVASEVLAQAIAIDIVFEDEHMLVVNKPAGLTVHPAPGHPDRTLVNALLAHCGETLSGIGGVARPGIVHRLDKDTSGLMVVAKHDEAHRALAAQLADRSLKRTYHAFCWGLPNPTRGTVRTQIGRSPRNRQKMAVLKKGGREAVTHYRVVNSFPLPLGEGLGVRDGQGAHPIPHPALRATFSQREKEIISLVECNLETGRTHQIRVHMHHLGHPILGDPTYGRQSQSPIHRQALHACRLQLRHPATDETLAFEIPLPEDMRALHESLAREIG